MRVVREMNGCAWMLKHVQHDGGIGFEAVRMTDRLPGDDAVPEGVIVPKADR
jgi:hypothetical protein